MPLFTRKEHEMHATPGGSEIDPVCHMRVDPATAAGKSEHAGKAYYFCAVGCKKAFDAEPHKYLGPHHH